MIEKIGFGGGCHWCTEAYFLSLKGVEKVDQGWINSVAPNHSFSEAVIVYFDPNIISIKTLISIHLRIHASTKKHGFREKYRSAVYVFDEKVEKVQMLITENQIDFSERIITQSLPFCQFRLNTEEQLNYYKKHKEGVFCERYISPKLQMIKKDFTKHYKQI
ncbi:peptide-methionine (S)-S-oxide reductase [Pedobacter sp. SD-b]|uniref:peptide-methionine (S)-S-oxide reductase n=1 Tax=Pedobacter segetis TaxID=2793069 RepID=A0ABS1BIK8_9SPHI|nr:peptide-methionine (S)-S-oxide reductase [Pedobacter segetis]MBK0382723.1 peptide-methionine (S)-S-oxide reductase [Pedobacter segetis]